MKDVLKLVLLVLVLLVVFGASIYGEMLVWQECRQTHSFLYCMSRH